MTPVEKFNIGDIVGINQSLLIRAISFVTVNGKRRKRYTVECQKCKIDNELYGDAIYTVDGQYVVGGKLPCGCSRNPKYSEQQWRVILKRKAESNNHIFRDFVNKEKHNQNSKLSLECSTCGNTWESCSLNNYMKDRSCPACANIARGNSSANPDDVWVERFRKTGLFPEDKFSFSRATPRSRLWEVYCTTCANDIPFISDRSNLAAGKVPCRCGTGGGFDTGKVGYFYLLKVLINGDVSLKYGITSFFHRRLVGHKRTLKSVCGVVLEQRVFRGKGEDVLSLESKLKREIPSQNKFIDGFRKEACSPDFFALILKSIKATGLEELEQVDNCDTIDN